MTCFLSGVLLGFFMGAAIFSTGDIKDFHEVAIRHHAGHYVSDGTSPNAVFKWNDEIKETK